MPSCNNEELYEIDESLITEELPSSEDETPPEDKIIFIEAENDTATTLQNTPVDIIVYTNDSNIPSSINITNTNPSNGDLTINDNGTPDNPLDDSIVYTPNVGFLGTDFFDYTICDEANLENCDTATVEIIVEPVNTSDVSGELKAFPTAYGGGSQATGGRGSAVYHVTNLNDSGSGSFREAISQSNRTVVFDVSGVIDLTSNIVFESDNLTIAGQTAPVGGITIAPAIGVKIRFQDCNNLIIRYIRIRVRGTATGSEYDAFDLYGNTDGAYNIILDHVSASYGSDETLSVRGGQTHNITYQRCLIAESKTGSLFGDSTNPEFSYDNSLLNCLYWNVSHRTPNSASNGRVDIINNVVQNWQYRLSMVLGDIQLNHINNYYAMGGRTGLTRGSQINLNPLVSSYDIQIYSAGNIIDKNIFTDPNADNKALWVEFDSGAQTTYAPSSEFTNTQYALIGDALPIQNANDAYADVITNVGANASLNEDGSVTYHTDANDTDYLDIMALGEGAYEAYSMNSSGASAIRSWYGEQRYANFEASITGIPINTRPDDYDTDKDGMPDIWEYNKFETYDRDGRGDFDGDGYTDLEEFIDLVDL
ncbi:pectate lyase [Flaviramulus aquimarinus]|uniref:Pectate lyase n=1 Tax=Flaviramulus aquimarinus TaxID=1170456 RepID=A0ABP9FFL2_9FLAO